MFLKIGHPVASVNTVRTGEPDICVPCNEVLLNHLSGSGGIVTDLALVSDVQVDRGLVRIEVGLGATYVVAVGAGVAPLRDVLVVAIHVGLQVPLGCTTVLAVFALKPAVFVMYFLV